MRLHHLRRENFELDTKNLAPGAHVSAIPALRLARSNREPRVAPFRAERFSNVQRHAAECPPELGPELAVFPRNGFHERPSQRNDENCMFENVLFEVSAHARPRRSLHATGTPYVPYFAPVAGKVRPSRMRTHLKQDGRNSRSP